MLLYSKTQRLPFGKYVGTEISWIITNDSAYLVYLIKRKIVKLTKAFESYLKQCNLL